MKRRPLPSPQYPSGATPDPFTLAAQPAPDGERSARAMAEAEETRRVTARRQRPEFDFHEADCGGVFDGFSVTSDADPGL
jgi:hypothetical protein